MLTLSQEIYLNLSSSCSKRKKWTQIFFCSEDDKDQKRTNVSTEEKHFKASKGNTKKPIDK